MLNLFGRLNCKMITAKSERIVLPKETGIESSQLDDAIMIFSYPSAEPFDAGKSKSPAALK